MKGNSSMKDTKQLRLACLFAQLSKLILSDERLLKFFGVRDNSKWNDSKSEETKTRVINYLRNLACQQQELLKYCDTQVQDIGFDAVKHMNILDDSAIILLYTKSRILFNERELAKKRDMKQLTSAMQYVNALKNLSKVVAIFPSTEHCTAIDLLPAMETKEFWDGRPVIRLDNGVAYFPTFIGTNITLGTEMMRKGNIIAAL